ncbi:translation repressor RelE [Alphaproteobacteria bacterium]|nr:translation repressor RelE [Alphaproteobacteria bacterium]
MIYKIEYSKLAQKTLDKLDSSSRKQILKYVNGVLSRIESLRDLGKALTGNLGNFWRYRTGNFSIICEIKDDVLVVLILKIAHRKRAYVD